MVYVSTLRCDSGLGLRALVGVDVYVWVVRMFLQYL